MRTHAQILADIAAKVVEQHRADVPGYAIEYPNECRCGPCTAIREYRERRECADLQTRIAEAAAEEDRIDRDPAGVDITWWYGHDVPDHTPDWDYRLDERWQG